MSDSPELAAAKLLLDLAKQQGFTFQRIAPGEDGPLLGVRDSPDYHDQIYISDFYSGCTATRARKSSLIVPGGLPITARVEGEALIVLHTAVFDWSTIG
jgi:hypothetical protein